MDLGTPASSGMSSDGKTQYAPIGSAPPKPPAYLSGIDPMTGAPKGGRVQMSRGQIDQALTAADPSYPIQMWLRGQSDISNAQYNDLMARNGLDSAADAAYYGNNAGYINASYGNNLGLLNEERYRNVDLARGNNDEDRRYITQTWTDLQKNLNNQRKTAIKTNDIQNWLYGQNMGFNQRDRDLNFNQAKLTRDDAWRGFTTDATARGARSSRGFGQNMQSAANQYQQGLNVATLGYDTKRASLIAGHQQDFQNLRAQLESQLANYNNGANVFQHGIFGVDQQGRIIDSMGRTYDLQGNQLAVDRDRSLNDNAHSLTQAESARARSAIEASMQHATANLAAYQQGLSMANR